MKRPLALYGTFAGILLIAVLPAPSLLAQAADSGDKKIRVWDSETRTIRVLDAKTGKELKTERAEATEARHPESAMDWGWVAPLVYVGVAVIGAAFLLFLLYNLAQKTVTRKVKVVGKRTRRVWAHHGIWTQYLGTFEFEDGQQKEYVVGKWRYDSVAEGDQGELDTTGVIFWDFRRVGQQVTAQEHGVVVDHEEAATDESADEDDLAEPTEAATKPKENVTPVLMNAADRCFCPACGAIITANDESCPSCEISFVAEGSQKWTLGTVGPADGIYRPPTEVSE
jgi:Protein of unknown function (DUF2500)